MTPAPPLAPTSKRWGLVVAWLFLIALCLLHGWAIWRGMDDGRGLDGPWPIARHDHSLYFHSAWMTRSFLRQSGTTAGYDPYFMAGYAKSVVFPASSTLPELVVAGFGRVDPVRAYQWYVFLSAAAVPWVMVSAGRVWRLRPWANAQALLLFLVYLWSDFPINYAAFGMLPYLLAVPLALLTTGTIVRFLETGELAWWIGSSIASSIVVLVHFTSAMVIAPAVLLAYGCAGLRWHASGDGSMPSSGASHGHASVPRSMPPGRHLFFWLIPPVVLAVNAFWWWPGLWLASTKGPSDFAFVHPESVMLRLRKIALNEPRIELVLWVFGVPGLVVLARRNGLAAIGLGGFIASGFAWGYLAGATRSLDFLQPGRHTYAAYTGLALASGLGLTEVIGWLDRRGHRSIAMVLGVYLLVVAGWHLGPELIRSLRYRVASTIPFLSSRPPPRLRWVVDRVKRNMVRGERLLYEEGGFAVPGVPDPFADGRYSGLLPYYTGVEVLGGPYLHAALTTNFTQFGEGKLFGTPRWDRDHFIRYARLYRTSAILCWTPHARAFCRDNPDLVAILDDDGFVLFGRVKGFGGATIRGTAEVEAAPGRLKVWAKAAEVDGPVVLRYHSVPRLRARPPVPLGAVRLEGDPVPFITLQPTDGPVTIELDTPP